MAKIRFRFKGRFQQSGVHLTSKLLKVLIFRIFLDRPATEINADGLIEVESPVGFVYLV
ncbi:MAG: hypothetical protein HKN76_16705 [Saprospiraceae bacterium]|nr:hypothetical protein [Saprospiraceae bacterium]